MKQGRYWHVLEDRSLCTCKINWDTGKTDSLVDIKIDISLRPGLFLENPYTLIENAISLCC